MYYVPPHLGEKLGTCMLKRLEGKTNVFVQATTNIYFVESGVNAKEIEMCTTAESLELWF